MVDTVEKIPLKKKKISLAQEVIKRLMRNKMAVAGLVILVVVLLSSLLAPLLSPYDYATQNYGERFVFPNWAHPFGTDNFGRDILTRVLYGGRYTLFIAFVVTSIAAVAGALVGLFAAYFPKSDNILMRTIDIFMGIPQMMMCVSIIAALGGSMKNMMIALTITATPEFARIMRAQVLTLKDQEFVEAARSIGGSNLRIMFRHILPNALAPIIVQYTLGAVNTILMSASLSFVGMGVQPPTPEWGLMISAGRAYLRDYWYVAILPGLAIIVASYALNLLGDGLRDALDPRLKR
ncbi:MAG: ABC transporter permease [Candidatus Pelethousia sp.]|nr:ABC transporter permease [Candidatus Pelethousia sp.]